MLLVLSDRSPRCFAADTENKDLQISEESAGQQDLDAAIEQKLSAQSLDDFERVIDLCRRAIRKGLPEDSKDFANNLIVGTLIDRSVMLVDAIFDAPRPSPDWPRMRSFAMRDLRELVKRDPKLGIAHLMIARLQALPGGNPESAKEAADKAIKFLSPDQNKIELAEAHIVQGNLLKDGAERTFHYDKAVALAPADSRFRRTRGLFRLLRNEFGPAREDFIAAIKQNPNESGVYEALGMSYMMDNELEDAKRLEEAKNAFDKAIEITPDSAAPRLQRARVLAMLGEQPGAIADLDKAVEMSAQKAAPLVLRARIQQQSGNLEAASADLAKVLKDQPENPAALELRGLISADAGDYPSAIRDFTSIAKQDPPDPLVMGQLGMLHLAAKQPRAAIKWFGKSLNLDKKLFLSLRGRSDALISIGEHTKAAKDLQSALKLQPADSGVLNNLAWLFATSPENSLRNGEKAITLATKACEETEWKAAHIISTLAAGYAENGDFEKACEYSNKALDADGGNGDIDEQLQKELSSYKEKKPWREKQSMPEAELQMKETPDASLEKKIQEEKGRENKVIGTGQQKPRRPFD
jgi:tetratricopeptide (TPR) repeat protein